MFYEREIGYVCWCVLTVLGGQVFEAPDFGFETRGVGLMAEETEDFYDNVLGTEFSVVDCY